MKYCPRCKQTLPKSEFYKRSNTKCGVQTNCKTCVRESSKKYNDGRRRGYNAKRYVSNKEAILMSNKRWKDNNPNKVRERGQRWSLKKKFGLTRQDYDNKLIAQGGFCAGRCGTHIDNYPRAFCIDHNHETGEIRGLLCVKCNTSLGLANDSAAQLRNLADYRDSYGN